MSAAAPATSMPSINSLTWDQRHALLTEIVKAWYQEVGPDVPLIVTDGDSTLGVFMSGSFPRPKPTLPPLTPEQEKELRRELANIREDELLTTEEALKYFETVLEGKHTR